MIIPKNFVLLCQYYAKTMKESIYTHPMQQQPTAVRKASMKGAQGTGTCLTVSKWCTNSSQPDLSTLKKAAELLDVDVKDLLWSTK